MIRFPLALGLAASLALTACQTAVPIETCTDRAGATFVKPASGCPVIVAAPPVAKAAPKRVTPRPVPVPVATERGSDGGGSDGGGSDGGGWEG